jgi:hypothetical protein
VPGAVLEVDQLVAEPPEERLDEPGQPLAQSARHSPSPGGPHRRLPKTKMGLKAHTIAGPHLREPHNKKAPLGGFPFMLSRGRRAPDLPDCRDTSHPSPPGARGRAFYPKPQSGETGFDALKPPRGCHAGTAPQYHEWLRPGPLQDQRPLRKPKP